MVMDWKKDFATDWHAMPAAMILLAVSAGRAGAGICRPPGAYQPIPNFTGVERDCSSARRFNKSIFGSAAKQHLQ